MSTTQVESSNSTQGTPQHETWNMLVGDPEVFNNILSDIGVGNVEVNQVYCLEDDLVQNSVFGFLVCLPNKVTKTTYLAPEVALDPQPIHIKQTIGNACGGVALLHCLVNNPLVQYFDDSTYRKINDICEKKKSYEERAECVKFLKESFEKYAESSSSSDDSPREKKADAPKKEKVVNHFEGIINFNNKVWILDGRKHLPVPVCEIPEGQNFKTVALKFLQKRIEGLDMISILSLSLL
ncbi:ubiquitin carboxyl-terminal hydrolase, putative [Entamoeba invadens IP1]|uniref:Ubiquitin carboxyl-terminal hydrolase n=1 Tax=Entamoeba invadens IP1 TaxID=370355 RepID=L7FL69_ENTIV|nr:ubiquitin carboxyl-terminal hydrolase, putative [Entamoeba invadens IP1]ELP87611.1 ubiquitin carboxyl-terminal hydrolase, putative [Entamoeba invadens IP1]|eukprot:XP_004254382.1 ubiquitin carboxyl-terminal hydrolase, putative [Entamoeba invadens IP1]